MLLKNARKGNGSGPELRFKNQSPRRSSIVDLTSFRRLFRAEAQRERRKKLAFPPVPLTRTARSHGLSSRPSITSFPIPYPSGHTTLPFLRHRVYPRTRGFTRFERGFKPGPRGFLARFPLHINCRRFGILCLPFFPPPPPPYSLLSLFDGRTRRRTAIITTMTDSDDRPTNHVNTTNNNKNDRPGSEAWRYRNSHRGHRGREWGEGRRGTASGARNSRAERGESFVFRNYERTGRWKGDLG